MNSVQRAKLVYVCIILILVLAILYSGLRILESTIFSRYQNQLQTTSKVLIRNGIRYYPRKDITVVLFMGINQSGVAQPTKHNAGGAADMVALLVFDEKTESCTVLSLNRDLMVDMPALNELGKEVGLYYGQLALSHTYGDGMEVSCENVRKTVSNLFYGLEIDYYVSMNIDAIALLNDAVGGVTVNIVDDFSAVDPELSAGKFTLKGKQAVTFVQTRWNVGDELNLSRMERQKEYMRGFLPMLKQQLSEKNDFAMVTYSEVADYIVTDCSASIISRLASDYGEYSVDRYLTLNGKNVLGEQYYEFYADERELDAMIIELFYAPKQ